MSQKIKTSVEIDGSLTASQIANATTDTDKFLVSDGGTVKYRTGAELASDLGIASGSTSKVQHQVKAGVAINKGQAVYVTSADGTNMIVGLASNASEATSSKTMGLLNATVAVNDFADVITEGLLDGLDTSTATVGNPVWLGTGGNLIYGLANKPYAPNHLVFIGIVTRVNANNGEIFVKVQNGFELDEIHDVDLKTTTKVNGHLLGYNGSLWVNKTIAEWLGYTPYNASNPAGYISSYTETDPTVPSHVKSITTTNISNWNTAYGWGNHASAGYLTSVTNITGYARSLNGFANQTEYTILDGPANGPVWKVRYDSATANRYVDLGFKDGNGVYSTGLKIYNGDTPTWQGSTLLHAGNYSSYAVPTSRTITINGTSYDLSANRSWTVSAAETDTLQTVTSRGATTNVRPSFDSGITVNGLSYVTANGYFVSGAQGFRWNDSSGNYNNVIMRDNGTTWFRNYLETPDSMRSPIYYDYNDTAYYGDFASTSYLRHLSVGDVNAANDGGWNARLNLTGSSHARLDVKSNSDGIITTMYSHAGQGVGKIGTYSNHPLAFMVNTGTAGYAYANYLQGVDSVRAPIFYDSNNTGYYIDPASTSRINTINLDTLRGPQGDWLLGYQSGTTYSFGSTAVSDTLNVDFNSTNFANGTSWFGGYGGGSGPGLAFENQGTFARIVFWNLDFYEWDSGQIMTMNNGYVQANNSFRAPIFYDSNDTSYYADFNSTSQSAVRQRGGTLHGPNTTWGAYLLVGGNGRTSYIDNALTASVCATDGNIHIDAGSGKNMYLNWYDGGAIIFGSGSETQIGYMSNTGDFTANSSSRAPIFYDSADTSYYWNPNTSSGHRFQTPTGYLDLGSMNGSWCHFQTDRPNFYFGSGVHVNGGVTIYGTSSYLDSGRVQAPIFYDSNNTGYYVDPASTSNFNVINSQGYNLLSRLDISVAAGNWYTIATNPGNRAHATFDIWDLDSGMHGEMKFVAGISFGGTGQITMLNKSWHSSGGIFDGIRIRKTGTYDTHYLQIYVSTSGTLKIAMTDNFQEGGWTLTNGGTGAPGAYTAAEVTPDSYGPGLITSGDIGIQKDTPFINFYSTSTGRSGYVGLSSGYDMRVSNASSGNLYLGSGNTVIVENNLQAAVFYDYNNTGYYLDPHSNSSLNTATFAGRVKYSNYIVSNDRGGMMGDYNITGTASKCIWTIGESWPLGNMYGLAYEYDGTYYHHLALKENGTTYARLGFGTAGAYFHGALTSGTSAYSPIYYDTNNTGFYLDPASTSNLNGLSLASASTFLGGLSIVRNGGGSDPYGVLGVSCPSGDNYAYIGLTRNGVIGMAMGIDTSNNFWIGTSGGGYNSVRTGTYVTITTGGTFTATGDVVAYSDKRVKENINTIDKALDKVLSLRGVTYNRTDKEDKSEKIGVIAQEIQEILPQVVQEQEDGMLGVSYGNITAVLIEAIKEQQTQIEELKELVNKLINK